MMLLIRLLRQLKLQPSLNSNLNQVHRARSTHNKLPKLLHKRLKRQRIIRDVLLWFPLSLRRMRLLLLNWLHNLSKLHRTALKDQANIRIRQRLHLMLLRLPNWRPRLVFRLQVTLYKEHWMPLEDQVRQILRLNKVLKMHRMPKIEQERVLTVHWRLKMRLKQLLKMLILPRRLLMLQHRELLKLNSMLRIMKTDLLRPWIKLELLLTMLLRFKPRLMLLLKLLKPQRKPLELLLKLLQMLKNKQTILQLVPLMPKREQKIVHEMPLLLNNKQRKLLIWQQRLNRLLSKPLRVQDWHQTRLHRFILRLTPNIKELSTIIIMLDLC